MRLSREGPIPKSPEQKVAFTLMDGPLSFARRRVLKGKRGNLPGARRFSSNQRETRDARDELGKISLAEKRICIGLRKKMRGGLSGKRSTNPHKKDQVVHQKLIPNRERTVPRSCQEGDISESQSHRPWKNVSLKKRGKE